jgi:hypothetical protein
MPCVFRRVIPPRFFAFRRPPRLQQQGCFRTPRTSPDDKPHEIRNSSIHPLQRDCTTMNFLIRLILIPAGIIAGWFVAKDAPNFGAVQTMTAIFLLVFILVVFGLTSKRGDKPSGS